MTTMPAPPENLADRPPPRDLLSELLRSVRLNGERIVAYGPMGTSSAGFAGIGALHIVDEGEVVLRIDGVPHVERASHGDVILVPRGDPHHISDAGERAHATARAGTSEDDAPQPARWLCGTFTIGDPQASHLLASLPA